MPALNPPGALPSEMQAVIRLLLSSEGQVMRTSQLEQLVTPPTLRGLASEDGERAESDTIRMMRSVGLLSENSGAFVLNRDVAKAIGRDFTAGRTRTVIRHTFLQNLDLEQAKTSNAGAADLARAAAWYLLQDPLSPPQRWEGQDGVEALGQRQLPFEARLENNARWGALDRWMPYLGLAVHDPRDFGARANLQVLVPDPTAAVREELLEVLPHPGIQQPLKEVIAELAKRCSVLDGGVYQRAIREMLLPNSLPSAADTISRSLSHSLLRLQDSLQIVLHDRADAEKVLLSAGNDLIAYSHVERMVT